MRTPIFSLVLSALLVAHATVADDKASHLAIVVNKNSSLSEIASVDLAKFFKAEKSKAPDGTKVVIVMQDAGRSEREAALRQIFKMSDGEYNKYFLQATFTGAVAAAPKALANSHSVVKFVSDTPGGLGYVKGDEADESVKVLKIDGKVPGETGYPLSLK